jgi:hypothetical protein
MQEERCFVATPKEVGNLSRDYADQASFDGNPVLGAVLGRSKDFPQMRRYGRLLMAANPASGSLG